MNRRLSMRRSTRSPRSSALARQLPRIGGMPSPGATARRYGTVFDEVAAEYDRHRPAYPDELIDRACQVAGIGRGDPVVEIGCGTGQLTRGLLARGLQVTALEPGPSLSALARQNLASAGAVDVVSPRVEGAPL